MSDRIPALLEPIQERLDAATPGPWVVGKDRMERAILAGPYEAFLIAKVGDIRNPLLEDNAKLIAHAPTDTARLLAAVKAVTEVHKPVTLWMAHEDADVSYQSKEDLLAERADLTEADLVPFELCSHCRMIEDSPCEGECTMSAGYRESLWPCETVSAVESALRSEA